MLSCMIENLDRLKKNPNIFHFLHMAASQTEGRGAGRIKSLVFGSKWVKGKKERGKRLSASPY